jgi:hypothetical protein
MTGIFSGAETAKGEGEGGGEEIGIQVTRGADVADIVGQ